MAIENMQQTLELLENVEDFFLSFDEIESNFKLELYNKEGERDDLLHEIELSKMNAIEIVNTYKRLETVLRDRRVIKNKLELINTLKPYVNKFTSKGICAETKATIKNIETLAENQKTRGYNPRILKDLKCAKKKEEI